MKLPNNNENGFGNSSKNFQKAERICQLMAILCISLIVSALSYAVNVSAQTQPEINVEIPRYYNENEIDITGVTEPLSTVRLYVNDMIVPRRALRTGDDGTINFERVALFSENNIKIWVQAESGETNEAGYEVTVDTENPILDLEPLPDLIGESNLTIKGSVDENVTIKFYLDSGSIDTTPPAKVTNLVKTKEDKNLIEFTWDESQDSDFAKYVVYRDDVGPIDTPKPSHYNSFIDPVVNSGVTYTYRVSVIDRAGNEGEKSDPLSVTTLEGGETDRDIPHAIEVTTEREPRETINIDGDFEVMLEPKEDGNYTLIIEAIDLALNNMVPIKKGFVLDTTPPEIRDLNPRSGQPIYENFADRVDIGGYTDPNINVTLFINKSSFGKERYTVRSNSEGYFKFRNVNLLSLTGSMVPYEVSTSELQDYDPAGIPVSARRAEVIIEATDALGRTAIKKVGYEIRTCWTGNVTWDVKLFDEFQSPTMLSTERIAEGTEWIYFMLNFTYARQGSGRITSLSVLKACDASTKNNPLYNWSCDIMPSTCRVESSPDKTAWFVSCPLKSMKEMNRWMKDDWKGFFKAINNEMIFPFKLRLGYTYEIDNKPAGSEYQTSCMSVDYVVDNTKVNFAEVLPDWLLWDTADWLNSSIADIDKFQKFMKGKIDFVGKLCVGTFAFNRLVKLYRKWTCYSEALGKWKSPEGLLGFKLLLSQSKRNELTNSELSTQLPACKKVWDLESKIYTGYRAFCDRVFCHSSPAKWTKEADESDLRRSVEAEKSCDTASSAAGQPLRKVKCRDLRYRVGIAKENIPVQDECFEVYINVGNNDIQRHVYSFDPNTASTDGVVKLTRYDRPRLPNPIYAIQQNDRNYLTKLVDKCDKVCVEKKYTGKDATSDCITVKACKDKNDDVNGIVANSFGFTNDCYYDGTGDINVITGNDDEREECCCTKPGTEPSKYYGVEDSGKGRKEIAGGKAFSDSERITADDGKQFPKFSYRYYSIDFETAQGNNKYNPKRYISGRDATACFGQNNWIDLTLRGIGREQQASSLDPFRNHWDSIQCGCMTGVYNRVTALKNMMIAMSNCLIQVRTTGTADAGVCKEVFSQYVCSLMWKVITVFRDGCYPWESTDPAADADKQEASIFDYMKGGATALTETISESGKDLTRDYKNVQLANMIGYGQEDTARRICLAAFGYDWHLGYQGMLDAAYAVPYKSLVQPITSSREYLTFDPSRGRGTAKYEYRVSWIINPGCEIEDYDIYLTCITRDEASKYPGINCDKVNEPGGKNCDCLGSNLGSNYLFYDGRRLEQGVLESRDKHEVVTSPYRYDHLKFVLKPSRRIRGTSFGQTPELKADCFGEGFYDADSDEAVYYFPIRDKTALDIVVCRVNVLSGEFECPSGNMFWGAEKNGQLLDEYTKINGQLARDGITIYVGEDNLNVEPSVYKAPNAPDMCLHISVKGENNNPEEEIVKAVIVPGSYQFAPIELLEKSRVRISGLSYKWLPSSIVTGRLIGPTMIGSNDIEVMIGFKDGDEPPDGLITLNSEKSNDLIQIPLHPNWVTDPSKEWVKLTDAKALFITPGLLRIKMPVYEDDVTFEIENVNLPLTSISGKKQEEVMVTLKISSQSLTKSSEYKTVEFILTNLNPAANGIFTEESDCNYPDVVRYNGELQQKRYRIAVRKRTSPSVIQLKDAEAKIAAILTGVRRLQVKTVISSVDKVNFIDLLEGAKADIERAGSPATRGDDIRDAEKKLNEVLKNITKIKDVTERGRLSDELIIVIRDKLGGTPEIATAITISASEAVSTCGHPTAALNKYIQLSDWTNWGCMTQKTHEEARGKWDACKPWTEYTDISKADGTNIKMGCEESKLCCPPTTPIQSPSIPTPSTTTTQSEATDTAATTTTTTIATTTTTTTTTTLPLLSIDSPLSAVQGSDTLTNTEGTFTITRINNRNDIITLESNGRVIVQSKHADTTLRELGFTKIER